MRQCASTYSFYYHSLILCLCYHPVYLWHGLKYLTFLFACVGCCSGVYSFRYWLSSNCKSVPEYELLVLFSLVWDYLMRHTHTAKKTLLICLRQLDLTFQLAISECISSMLEPSKVWIIFTPSTLLFMLLLALRISFLKYSNIEEKYSFLNRILQLMT